jgi:SAM-dependent methyltransferase
VDWSLGRYEQIAGQLLPAAEAVVERAAPDRDERVVDVGCGTGNAALLAAERGARVTGIDPAERLLDVARTQALARGLELELIRGEAAALPLVDASADVVLSVFGVIFAPDASAAAAEMARVTAPAGRIVLCAWIPEGPLTELARLRGEAIAAATGAGAGAAPFPWHDGEALTRVFAPHGFSVSTHEQRLEFTAASARAFGDSELRDHPTWVAAHAALEPAGRYQAIRDRALQLLQDANEDPGAFRLTSRYVVAAATRHAQA